MRFAQCRIELLNVKVSDTTNDESRNAAKEKRITKAGRSKHLAWYRNIENVLKLFFNWPCIHNQWVAAK